MAQATTLRQFSADELLLDEEESRIILQFFYPGPFAARIDTMRIDDRARAFAQGLLVEAIERSYQMGFVEALFRASANPTKGATAILKSFGKRARKHWFKHATPKDLSDIKIYDMVRDRLAVNFHFHMHALIEGYAKGSGAAPTVVVHYPAPRRVEMVWG